jgi:hypothetical protein
MHWARLLGCSRSHRLQPKGRKLTTARKTESGSTDRSDDGKYHGTADFHEDGPTVRRSVTVRRPRDEVERAWRAAGIPGTATFTAAAGDRGIEVRVVAPREEQSAMHEIVGAFTSDDPGSSLSSALRDFKARLEAGEAPTTKGQPSGREASAN